MYGRYGVDELYKFMLFVYVILLILNIFLNNRILTIIELVLALIIIYRSFSKNIYSRQKENRKYKFIKNRITSKFYNTIKRFKDRNSFMYKKCPYCKEILRLPLKKGTHTVKCPCCKNKFEVKCKRDAKVEVIRN